MTSSTDISLFFLDCLLPFEGVASGLPATSQMSSQDCALLLLYISFWLAWFTAVAWQRLWSYSMLLLLILARLSSWDKSNLGPIWAVEISFLPICFCYFLPNCSTTRSEEGSVCGASSGCVPKSGVVGFPICSCGRPKVTCFIGDSFSTMGSLNPLPSGPACPSSFCRFF